MRKHAQLHDMSDPERPRLDDSIYEEPQAHVYGKDPVDGLPRMTTPPLDQTQAPPLSPDRFVCMKDERKLVDREGNVFDGNDERVRRMHNGAPFLVKKVKQEKRKGKKKKKKLLVLLSPVRPQCEHYKRQLVPFGENGDRVKMNRTCTAAMNSEGEYYSISDQEVLACEFRCPPDPKTTRALDEFDRKAIEAHEETQEQKDDFDPLVEMTGGGILGSE